MASAPAEVAQEPVDRGVGDANRALSARYRGHRDGCLKTSTIRRLGREIRDQSWSHRVHDCSDVLPLPAGHRERPREAEHAAARKQDGEL
jgi:hypothetical protein